MAGEINYGLSMVLYVHDVRTMATIAMKAVALNLLWFNNLKYVALNLLWFNNLKYPYLLNITIDLHHETSKDVLQHQIIQRDSCSIVSGTISLILEQLVLFIMHFLYVTNKLHIIVNALEIFC